MALNKFFDIEVIHEGTDITEYCSPKNFTAANRNLDCTQIFTKLDLNISLLAPVAFTVKENDLFFVRFESAAHYYRATTIEETNTHLEIELSNVFELLEDKRFFVGEEGSETVNTIISSFLDSSEDMNTADLNNLLRMICALAIDDSDLSNIIALTTDSRSLNYTTDTETAINDIGSLITINKTIADWGKDITPSELLELLQLEYCFNIVAISTYNSGFETICLPTMQNLADYTVPSGGQLIMPDFFRIDTINKLLNPVRQLDKAYYHERPALITKKKKGIEIKDVSGTSSFKFEYRNDLDVEEIEYPDDLDLSIHFTPLKIQFDGSNYIFKAGYYNAYHLYFSYVDILQNPSFKLDYQIAVGYQKADYKFTNETDETDFTNPKNSRKCVFDNNNFIAILTDNRVVERNNLRG